MNVFIDRHEHTVISVQYKKKIEQTKKNNSHSTKNDKIYEYFFHEHYDIIIDWGVYVEVFSVLLLLLSKQFFPFTGIIMAITNVALYQLIRAVFSVILMYCDKKNN